MINVTDDALKAEFDDLLHAIKGLAGLADPKEKSDSSHRLLGSLVAIVTKLNSVLRHELEDSKPSSNILDKLDQWIKDVRHALSQIAAALEAQSYTIGFDVPFGINMSMTFTPKIQATEGEYN